LLKCSSEGVVSRCCIPSAQRRPAFFDHGRGHQNRSWHAGSGQTGAVDGETNVFGTELQPCGTDPLTGFYRDGCCSSGPAQARHLVCAVLTTEFLDHQRSVGNDLITPVPEYGFPGLQPGDRWCVVAERWAQAYEAGVAPPVLLACTNARALEVIDLAVLRPYAVDVPEDLSSLE
jgi:uncharacterized protein